MIALWAYQDDFGCLPPAYTVDSRGKPLHSWRTLLLPYLERQDLYNKIDWTKPWNDPANTEVFNAPISTYNCPKLEGPATHTTYLAIVGDSNYLHPTEPRQLDDITDDHSDTVAVMEVEPSKAVHWMAPIDVDEKEFIELGTQTPLAHQGFMNVAFVDGSVSALDANLSADRRRAMVTIAGGEKAPKENAQ